VVRKSSTPRTHMHDAHGHHANIPGHSHSWSPRTCKPAGPLGPCLKDFAVKRPGPCAWGQHGSCQSHACMQHMELVVQTRSSNAIISPCFVSISFSKFSSDVAVGHQLSRRATPHAVSECSRIQPFHEVSTRTGDSLSAKRRPSRGAETSSHASDARG
jgi:hypothetical protein